MNSFSLNDLEQALNIDKNKLTISLEKLVKLKIIKKEYLNIEVDAITTDLMKKIKSQFDPGCILNPDKSF